MGAKVTAAWEQAVRLLHDCNIHSGGEQSACCAAVEQLLDKLTALPTPPKAVWKKLVQELKVRI
jgi:hypothetical protein